MYRGLIVQRSLYSLVSEYLAEIISVLHLGDIEVKDMSRITSNGRRRDLESFECPAVVTGDSASPFVVFIEVP